MNINNNFTPLAWHKGDIEMQSHRATYAFGHVVPLIVHNQTFIPFQLITETGDINMNIYTLYLKNLDGTNAISTNLRTTFGLVKVATDTCDVFIYNGGVLSTTLPTGQYYLQLTSGSNVWYSDVVTVVNSVLGMTRIEWYDTADLVFGAGIIKYKYTSGGTVMQYKNRMYFMEELGMPEYTNEEEGETRDGLFYATKILSGKKYKMTVAQCSEAMCDAMRFVHLSDYVDIRDGYGRMYSCDSVLVTPNWVNGGAVASCDIEITTDTFVKTLGGTGTGNESVSGQTGIIGQAVIGETFVIGA